MGKDKLDSLMLLSSFSMRKVRELFQLSIGLDITFSVFFCCINKAFPSFNDILASLLARGHEPRFRAAKET